ncbi:hypothetical protein [Streptomyces decoyicus]|uniref:hypothetical protein n=1 Tax=Streptomyces decoyicus TaxID=249567 RepID=UPI00386F3755|nr:hypothetical protein OG532_15850 [Streptomyces decoyicus]
MRVRLLLTGIAVGATVLAGAATAQAAPAPAQTATTPIAAGHWKYDGTYSESACYSLAASYAGPAYCTPRSGKDRYALYIWVE